MSTRPSSNIHDGEIVDEDVESSSFALDMVDDDDDNAMESPFALPIMTAIHPNPSIQPKNNHKKRKSPTPSIHAPTTDELKEPVQKKRRLDFGKKKQESVASEKPFIRLDDDQCHFIDTVIAGYYSNPRRSIFLTGVPGSGKTWLFQYVRQILCRAYFNNPDNANDGEDAPKLAMPIATPTAAAAVHITDAVNLHLLLGIKRIDANDTALEVSDRGRKLIMNMQILFYDELSMMHAGLFILLDRLFRQVRNIYSLPFGGVMVIMGGDFFQLPPVDTTTKFGNKQAGRGGFINSYEGGSKNSANLLTRALNLPTGAQQIPMLFELPLWRELNPQCCLLRYPHRQSGDVAFAELLGRLRRTSQLSPQDMQMLKSRCMPINDFYRDQSSRGEALDILDAELRYRHFLTNTTNICFTKADVKRLNDAGLVNISTDAIRVNYEACLLELMDDATRVLGNLLQSSPLSSSVGSFVPHVGYYQKQPFKNAGIAAVSRSVGGQSQEPRRVILSSVSSFNNDISKSSMEASWEMDRIGWVQTFCVGAPVVCIKNMGADIPVYNGSKGVVVKMCTRDEWEAERRRKSSSRRHGVDGDTDDDLSVDEEAAPPRAPIADDGKEDASFFVLSSNRKHASVKFADILRSHNERGDGDVKYPLVEFVGGYTMHMVPKLIDMGTGIKGSLQASRNSRRYVYALRIPLELAYAFTVHSQQGQTLNSVYITPSNTFCEPGQLYVALSRARDLTSVGLAPNFDYAKLIKTDERVVKFEAMLEVEAIKRDERRRRQGHK